MNCVFKDIQDMNLGSNIKGQGWVGKAEVKVRGGVQADSFSA